MDQDKFYLEKEANAFFDRWEMTINKDIPINLRDNKVSILTQLNQNLKLENLEVLEVGCFIGDLLKHLRNEYHCVVHGVETSSKACEYARNKYDLVLENTAFVKSSFFNLKPDNFHKLDLIIAEDVLSWMSRDFILPILGVFDWMLKPGGCIFLRDFSPAFSFAYKNHHWPGEKVFNFKQQGGHRKFFLDLGKYVEQSTMITNTSTYQKVSTSRPDSAVWADSILVKLSEPLHPVLEL